LRQRCVAQPSAQFVRRHGLELRDKAAAASGISAAAFAFSTPLLAGLAQPGYQHCSQFISELGQAGAPHAMLVRFAGFLPTGLLTLAFALLSAAHTGSTSHARFGFVLFSAVGWAYLAAAFFPCDPGCPSSGSTTQQIHNAFGALEYLAGGAGLALLGGSPTTPSWTRGPKQLSVLGSAIVFTAFAAMLIPDFEPVRGLFQRGADATLFLAVVVWSVRLLAGGVDRVAPDTTRRPSAHSVGQRVESAE
jgi:hypothetical protein